MALATSSIVSAGTSVARLRGRGGWGPVVDSDQDASAGRTRVATQPGGPQDAATASAASAATSSARAVERYHPETGPGDGRDVRLEGRVVTGVVGGVVAHDVDERRAGPPCIVQVGQPVAEARPEMQQGRRRPAGDPPVAVGGTGDDALEEAEDAAHGRHVVQRGHEVHLGGPRVGEADVNAGIDERRKECSGAVHERAPARARRAAGPARGCLRGRRPP